MGKRKLHEFIDNVEHKCCTMCKQWKILNQFAKHKRKWDKLQSNCKTCANKKQKQRDEKALKKREAARKEARGTGFLVCLKTCCTVKQLLQPIDQFISAYVRNNKPTDTCKTCRKKEKEERIRREAPCQKVYDDWRKTHRCVKCTNDPNYEHNPLLIEADHLPEFEKVKACSEVGYWSAESRGPAKLRKELMKCQALCGFHHALVTQQRRNETKDPRIIRKRAVINTEKYKRGCCSNPKCKRVLKKGEECAFHFDHCDPTTKFIRNGKAVSPATLVYFEQPLFDTQWPLEQAKCDLLCTNCHMLKDNRDGYRK